MRWLHLTDLHWGSGNEQQEVAAAGLILAIEEYSDSRFDCVFLTGDIAYSGKATECQFFEDDFLRPLRNLNVVGQ